MRCPHHARVSAYNSSNLNDTVSSHTHTHTQSLSFSPSRPYSYFFVVVVVELHGLLSTYIDTLTRKHVHIHIRQYILYTPAFYGWIQYSFSLSVYFGELGEDKNRKTATYNGSNNNNGILYKIGLLLIKNICNKYSPQLRSSMLLVCLCAL